MLIPIGHEDQQVTRRPWVTILLVTVNVVAFLLTNQAVQQQSAETRQRAQEIVRYVSAHPYLNVPPEIRRVVPSVPARTDLDPDTIAQEQSRLDAMWDEFTSGARPNVFRTYGYIPAAPSLLALFTSMFLHGGWLHLLGNMLFLWLAGASLEDRWGRLFYPIFYLVGGVVAALIHAAMTPQSSIPMVGASGAIAGLMGAFLVRFAMTRIRFFYWLLLFRGTFVMPAYVALPLWLLQQFAMARSGAAGGIAVWAHIGGFLFGVLVAVIVSLTDLEKNILAPGIAKRTSWSPSEHLTAALGKLDRGDADGGIQDLVALLTRSPNSIEARTALVGAYTQKGDTASAGRESARLVSAYVVARDLDGALAALEEHRRAHPDVPLALRSLLVLAAHREKQERFREAADLYHKAVQAWPDDPLVPKALIAHGRLMLEDFQQPEDALAILEGAVVHPQTTPEFRRAIEALMVAARRARPATAERAEPAPATAEFEPTSLTAQASKPPPQESGYSAMVEMPSVEIEPAAPVLQSERAGDAAPEPTLAGPMAAPPAIQSPAAELASDGLAEPPPSWKLAPVPMRAVAIDARGLRLQNREGKIGQLPWQSVAGVSVASIEDPTGSEPAGDQLVLDLLMAPKSTPEGDVVRCVRITGADLAIPQLQAEPSPARKLQRLVATILKATSATAYPSREDCLGLRGFPVFSDLGAYETALVACLRLAAA
jgi:membrane associated rhomboid family serine protease